MGIGDTFRLMEVVDEFLQPRQLKALVGAVLADSFPWEASEILANRQLPEAHNRQLVHGFFLEKPGLHYRSPRLPLLDAVLAGLQPRALLKAKLNLSPRQDTHVEYGMHVDTRRRGATTAILYLNTNNGYTLFEDGTRVASVANRLVLFDAGTRHTGASCTDTGFRLVLNINMFT